MTQPTQSERSLRVTHLPSWNDPYQRQLIGSLRDLGVDAHLASTVERFGLDLTLLAALIRGEIGDAVHVHWQHPLLLGRSRIGSCLKSVVFVAQLLMLRGLGVRLVWTVHNLTNHEKRFVRWEVFFSRILARVVHSVVVHCNRARELTEDTFGLRDTGHVTVIPHGHFLDLARRRLDRHAARTKLDLPQHAFIFLFFGLIRPYKGLGELLHAFEKLDDVDAILMVAGECRDEEVLGDLSRLSTSQRVRTRLGFLPQAEVGLFMAAADVVVYPYRDILTSGGIITAMSWGKPVIAPDLGCIPETLPASPLLYENDTRDGLFNALQAALDMPRCRLESIGRANREACSKVSWVTAARLTTQLYR